jgi:aspartate carbamoyltransferase regulatory subunit
MKEIKVAPIKNGTVIDHITCGMAFKVLKVLGISDKDVDSTVSMLMHVPSKKMEWKDIVKVEDKELEQIEVDKISLVAPDASINIIRNYEVVEKMTVSLPDVAVGILKCGNPNCVTNANEPVETEFTLTSKDPIRLSCKYCDRELDDIVDHII